MNQDNVVVAENVSEEDIHQYDHELQALQEFAEGETLTITSGFKGVMKELGASSRDLWTVPVEKLELLPNFNSRIHDDAYESTVRRLADSMKMTGYNIEHPLGGVILNEGGKKVLRIHAGYRRFAAIHLANKELNEAIAAGSGDPDKLILRVPVVVRPEGTSITDLTVDLVVGNSGEKLKPIEVAAVCNRLKRQGLSNQEISDRCQLGGASYVEGLLMLLGGPAAVREMVIQGLVSATYAIEVLREHGSNAADFLREAQGRANAAGKQKITKRFTPGAVSKKMMANAAPTMRTAIDAIYADPGLAGLSQDTRNLLDKAIALIKEAEAKEAESASQASLGGSNPTQEAEAA